MGELKLLSFETRKLEFENMLKDGRYPFKGTVPSNYTTLD
jgi:hypothetical protein